MRLEELLMAKGVVQASDLERAAERRQLPLACYQPRFIVDQIVEACAFDETPPLISESSVVAALDNLYITGPKNRALAAA